MSVVGNHGDAHLSDAVAPAPRVPEAESVREGSEGPQTPPDPATVRALIARISDCEGLRRSHRLRAFLSYVTEHALAGRTEDITELQIAFHVFGRKTDYDSSVHNLVRVQARLLRQKLADYFAGAGASEPLIVEIPKGGYVPVFVAREQEPELAAAPAASPRPQAPRWLIGLCVFFALTSVWLGWEAWRAGALPAKADAGAPALASFVLEPGKRTLVVPPDTALVVAQFLTGKTISLETYAGAGYRNELLAWNHIPHAQEFFGYLISRRYTDTFAATFYQKLHEVKSSAEVELRHPRSIQLRDFAGRNAVLVGSTRSNPWIEAFRNEMTLQFAPDPAGNGEVIRNTRPKPNEPGVLSAVPLRLGSGTGLGLIGLFANPYGSGRILLISGTSGGVTEQMAELAAGTSALPLVEKALGTHDLAGARYFEAAFAVELVGDAPRSWRPLIWRVRQ